ncbi:hypothetical protein N9T33_04235 [Pseudomonadota bacterium]|nr:hypothetical protein [Pseudomonadota bacterium]
MSSLKKFNIPEKISLIKNFFYEYVFIRSSAYAIGFSIIFSLFFIQISEPQFYISATLREAGDSSMSGSGVSSTSAQSLLGVAQIREQSNSFDQFRSNMFSYVLAQRMWDQGWGSKIFGTGNLDKEYFNKIPKKHSISDKLVAFFLGYELFTYFTAHDLQAFIKNSVKASKEIKGTDITVYTLSADKDFSIGFLNAVIKETDLYAREYLISSSNGIIDGTYKQLAVSKNSAITAALANTINSEYFKIAKLETDMPYHVYFIDPPYSSEYPVTPKVSSIILSSAIVFLFFSILYVFISKNKNDLW